ncbi:MAG: hypothetical protein FWD69_08235 [Polyangiaceae bacterium]|nr:hypothetical protein [Polyangiaceae bacterium]
MVQTTTTPSKNILEQTPGRALTFLRGLTKSRVLYMQLAAAGYTADDHQEGWHLLFKASGYVPTEPPPRITKSPAFDALTELDAWDESGFARVRAALERLHPHQAAFVFAGPLTASTGAGAVVGVKTLLDRLDALESGKGRDKSDQKGDAAAIATLDKRGITKAERKRLRALVDAARDVGDAEPEGSPAVADSSHSKDLAKLYAWYKDWSVTAHSVIKKRASLIMLGLAKRKSSKSKGDEAPAADGSEVENPAKTDAL